MSLQIDLGKVSAVSVNHDWNLTATTSIRLNVSDPGQSPPSGDLLFWLKQSRPWIGRANGLHITVQVLDEGRTLQQSRTEQSVLHALRDAVANAELWKQLHLDATLSDLSSPSTTQPPSPFTLQLRHATTLDAAEVRRLHRLPVGASAADLLPPTGVVACGLEQIFIVLDFTRSRVETNLDTDTAPSASTSLVRRHLNTTEAVELADAALRSIICPKPSKLSLGIWIPKTAETCAFSTIAPAIWSPGYAAAVSERVCFLPIITHALSHSLAGRVRSTSLKDKLLRLQSLADGSTTSAETSSSPVVYSLSDLIKAKLWRVVQKGVFKEDAGAELKPLTIPVGSVSEIGDDDDLDVMESLTSPRHHTAGRRSQPSNDDHSESFLTRSPQLIGNLTLPYHQNWDGGLLAQPVNVHHILAQLGSTQYSQYSQVATNQYDQDMSSLLSDDDDDGLLSSEANPDDAMLSDAEEISAIIGSNKDNGSILSDSSFDSFLLDDNMYDDGETPQTSQESADAYWMAGRTVDPEEHQQPVHGAPLWRSVQQGTVDCGSSMIQDEDVDDDYLISDVDDDDEMLDDWADDYDMLED